ncbi:beta-1,3-galactosyltransferase 5-like [Heptranchias perlo]|uniref:beta-1,3-galactosyltransferase 5-like n=1 Tax=Heptranchias perlo TaxID=212740 RepID=UPI003559ED04
MINNKFLVLLSALCTISTLLMCVFYLEKININYTVYKTNKKSIPKDGGDFLIIPESNCDTDPPFLVLLVTVTHSQWKQRDAIRQTWGRDRNIDRKRTAAYFLLGYNERYPQATILNESLYYQDIIQKNFTDTYNNLTLKVLMGIEWVQTFCPSASFVMKTDSDMFVNTYYLTELLSEKNRTRFFTGFIKAKEMPIRYSLSKWHMTKEEYPHRTYPPFCSGTGYVFSGDLVEKILTVSKHIPILKLEDVYIGLCLKKLSITPVELYHHQTFYARKVKFSVCNFQKLVTSHGVSPTELLIYWKTLGGTSKEDCSRQN